MDGYACPQTGVNDDYGKPFNGEAIYGTAGGRDSTIVLDCAISNCAAYNYASGREVSFVNSLILGKSTVGMLVKTVSNCVFAAGMGSEVSVTNNSFNCRFASAEELQVAENLRPIAVKNVACDIADAEAQTNYSREHKENSVRGQGEWVVEYW